MLKNFSRGVALGVAVAVSLIAACTSKPASDPNQQVVRVMLKDDIKTLDPANAYDTVSLEVGASIYETLYEYDYLADVFKPVPVIAADMPKMSKDGLTVTIPIKTDVRYQDDPCFKQTQGKGRAVTAQDFIYGMKRLTIPSLQSPGTWLFEGKIKGYGEFMKKMASASKEDLPKIFEQPIEGLQALDEHTLQIKLEKTYPQLIYALIMTFSSPLARECVEAYADPAGNLIEKHIGTGPYILKEWTRSQRAVLEKNPNYHAMFYPTDAGAEFKLKGFLADSGKKLPFVDKVVFEILKEEQPRWLNFMKGNLDAITVPKDNLREVLGEKGEIKKELGDKGYQIGADSSSSFYYVGVNMKDPLLGKNKFLRQALSSAFSREKWIEMFTDNTYLPQVSLAPPGLLDRAKTAKIKYDYNVERAKELLKKAGYPEGNGLPVIKLDMRGAATQDRQLGEFFTQQFAAIGVKVDVIYNTFPAYLEKIKQGNIQLEQGGWTLDYPDVENVYQLLYGPNKAPGPNEVNFANAEYDAAYAKMSTLMPGATRAALIQRMDDIVQEEVPWFMGVYVTDYRIIQPKLKNFRASNVIITRYKYLRMEK